MDIPEWLPAGIGIAAIATALVLTVLEALGIIELTQARPEEEGCQFCGRTPVCEVCERCFDPQCNAGCIWCRTPPKRETCPCCGQAINSCRSSW